MADFFAKGKKPINGYGGGNLASKSDLTNVFESGTTASQAISAGTYFYLNGTLVRAKTAIASGATFTENTNYEVVTAGALNAVNANNFQTAVSLVSYTSSSNLYTFPTDGYVHIQSSAHSGNSVNMYLFGASGNISILKTASLARDYVYVKAGMRAYFSLTGSDNVINFYGLV